MTIDSPAEPAGPLLGPDDIATLESFVHDDGVGCDAVLEYLGSFISRGVSEGRFTEAMAHHDLDVALWIGYACINYGDYEHAYTAAEWLSRVEDIASGCGVWYYRYANALMYCGRPGLALEYCERGAREDPGYPWIWLTLGRLRSHFGDRHGAVEAASSGLGLVPDDYEFLTLLADIEGDASIEQMEMHPFDGVTGDGAEEPERNRWRLYVDGIVCDRRNLLRLKETLHATGWMPDHPYCTYLMDHEGGALMVTLGMSEAQASKLDPESISDIVGRIGLLDGRARDCLSAKTERTLALGGMTIGPGLDVTLSYTVVGSGEVLTVGFDSDLEPLTSSDGGPYAAMVLLDSPTWDPGTLVSTLKDVWGLELSSPEVDGDSIIAGMDGHLVAVTLVRSPVPGDESVDAALNNYMWPEGPETVRGHRAHLVVALVNHGGDPVDCGLDFLRLVDSCVRSSRPIGVYQNGTVYRPEFYLMETETFRTKGTLPVLVMIWIGMYRTQNGICAYTSGLTSYAREEMEVLDADDESFNVMNFLFDVVYHSFLTGSAFRDGDTFGFGPEQVLEVSRSVGVSVDGYSLKLQYPGRRT